MVRLFTRQLITLKISLPQLFSISLFQINLSQTKKWLNNQMELKMSTVGLKKNQELMLFYLLAWQQLELLPLKKICLYINILPNYLEIYLMKNSLYQSLVSMLSMEENMLEILWHFKNLCYSLLELIHSNRQFKWEVRFIILLKRL